MQLGGQRRSLTVTTSRLARLAAGPPLATQTVTAVACHLHCPPGRRECCSPAGTMVWRSGPVAALAAVKSKPGNGMEKKRGSDQHEHSTALLKRCDRPRRADRAAGYLAGWHHAG